MPDIEDGYDALRRDVDGGALADPARLRAWADRRARRRATIAAACVVVLAGGGVVLVNRVAPPPSKPVAPVTVAPEPPPAPTSPTRASPSPTVSPPPSSPSSSPTVEVPRKIPASAFLRMPADMRVSGPRPATAASALPELCGGELGPGDGVAASAAKSWNYKRPEDLPGTIYAVLYETIRSYEDDGAAAFMDRLRDDLAQCGSYKDDDATVKVRTASLSGAGDEALTIDLVRPQLDPTGTPEKGTQSNRVVVIRFGPVITVLTDAAYERGSSDPALIRVFVRETEKAVANWRQ